MKVGHTDEDTLSTLAGAFVKLKARSARQGRRVRQLASKADEIAMTSRIRPQGAAKRASVDRAREELGHHKAWARWSETASELAEVADNILRLPASTISEFSIKFDALLWTLLDDDAVLDRVARRNAQRYARELAKLRVV